jgi:hypothetical protein
MLAPSLKNGTLCVGGSHVTGENLVFDDQGYKANKEAWSQEWKWIVRKDLVLYDQEHEMKGFAITKRVHKMKMSFEKKREYEMKKKGCKESRWPAFYTIPRPPLTLFYFKLPN